MSDNAQKPALKSAERGDSTVDRRKSIDGRIDRIVSETRHLSDDLTEWVNLRIRLVQIDLQERIDGELDFVFSSVVVIALIVVALMLGSIGLSFVIGELMGNASYGFAIMTLFYLLVALIFVRVRPRLAAGFRTSWMRERREEADEAKSGSDS